MENASSLSKSKLKKLANGTNNFWITQGLPFPFVSQNFRTFQNSQLPK
jgi:hypothetical protein